MADGFFHLSHGPGVIAQNSVRLSRALRAARASNDIGQRMLDRFDQRGSQIRERYLAIQTKFNILEVVTQRLGHELRMLLDDLAQNPGEANACAAAVDTAYSLKDPDLAVRLVESVDAFIYQHRSAYEMMGEFVREFCQSILQSPIAWRRQEVLERIAEAAGADTTWTHTLRESRHYFAHDKAPWMGVRLVGADRSPKVVVLKSDVSDLAGSEVFLTLEQIQTIHRGFINAVDASADWLVDQIERHECA
jgi:hypothetical protein